MRSPFYTLIALLLTAAPALAARPISAHRVVRQFDFEERAITTEPVPQHWVRLVHQPGRVERPGFPPWNESGFDDFKPYDGDWAVKLPTRGGSAALRLAAGVVPVVPQADYTVTAEVRTRDLHQARARLIARFLDADLKQIPGSQHETPLIKTSGEWKQVAVELWGDFPDAAWVQIDLLLLQPSQIPGLTNSTPADLIRDDLSGAVWFDDVTIMQIPRIEITTNSPTNVIQSPTLPALNVRVRDLTGERLHGRLTVRDINNNVLTSKAIDLPPASPATSWSPTLERYGWHRATLDVWAETRTVGSATIDFVWAPPGIPDPVDAPRFHLIDEQEPIDHLNALPALLAATGVGGVQIAVPEENPDIAFPPLEAAIMEALERRYDVALQFGRVSEDLARRLHIATDDVLALPLEQTSEAWSTFIEPALDLFGQRVTQWQLGRAKDDHSTHKDLIERRDAFQSAFERLSPEPVLASPWSVFSELDPDAAAIGSVTFSLPPAVAPQGIPDLARAWNSVSPSSTSTLLIEPPDTDPRTRVRQLAIRTLHAWDTTINHIAYRIPWSWSGSRRPQPLPTPELAVIRTLTSRLHSRTTAGWFPMPEGAHAMMLTGLRGDALVLWNEYAKPENAVLHAYLGDRDISAYDLYGNAVPLSISDGRHLIPLTQDPIFIEDVDINLLLFQSHATIEPGFLASEGARKSLELVLTNPWPDQLSGRVRLLGPERWHLAPRVQQLNIAPNQTVRLPFEISLGVAEEAGFHTIPVETELHIARELLLMTLSPSIEIGLENLSLQGGVRLVNSPTGGPADVVVLAIVTNLGQEPVSLTVASLAIGRARQQAPISALAPGDSAVRQFRYDAAEHEIGGTDVRLALIETEGAERLNRTIKVPEAKQPIEE